MRNKILWFAKLVFSCALLVYLAHRLDWERLQNGLSRADTRWLIAPVLIWLINLCLFSLRWRIVLESYGLLLPFSKVLGLNCMGSFVNNCLPTSVGGDTYKFILLNRENPGKKSILISSMFIERGLGLFAAIIIICLVTPLVDMTLVGRSWYAIALAIAASGMAGIWVVVGNSRFSHRLESADGISSKFRRITYALLSFSNPRNMLQAVGISFVSVIVAAFSAYSMFLCFRSHPPLLLVLFLHPLISLLGILPVSINNFGVAESAGYFLYSLYGIPAETALLVYFAGNVLLLVLTSIGAVVLVAIRLTSKHIV